MSEPSKPAAPAAGFSIVRVLMLVVLAGAIGGGAFLWMEAGNRPKPLVPFSGQVKYKGAPVQDGSVLAQNIDDPLDTAIGPLDSEGRFTLETNGEPGVRLGRHRIAVSALKPGIPPTPLVPAVYVDPKTSPLRIEATENPETNTAVFELEGELPEPPAPMVPPAPAGPSPNAADRPATEDGSTAESAPGKAE
jgi:hypothetical protein